MGKGWGPDPLPQVRHLHGELNPVCLKALLRGQFPKWTVTVALQLEWSENVKTKIGTSLSKASSFCKSFATSCIISFNCQLVRLAFA